MGACTSTREYFYISPCLVHHLPASDSPRPYLTYIDTLRTLERTNAPTAATAVIRPHSTAIFTRHSHIKKRRSDIADTS